MKAIVAGGGIGGLAAALALQRAGVEVSVLERRAELSKVAAGAGLMVWHNGTSALERLGVGDAVTSRSTPIDRFEFRTWRGAPLACWQVGELGRELGAPTVGINRADLHVALAAPWRGRAALSARRARASARTATASPSSWRAAGASAPTC